MPTKQLSEKLLKSFEEVLQKEKEETLKIIRDISATQSKGSKNENGDLSSYSTHQADHGTDTDNHEREVYHLETLQNKVKEINRALHRIYDKTFGICELCGCVIEEKRLIVVPYATMCIECKKAEENSHKRKR